MPRHFNNEKNDGTWQRSLGFTQYKWPHKDQKNSDIDISSLMWSNQKEEENSGFCVGKQILLWFGSFWAWQCPTLVRVKHPCRIVVIRLNLALSTWYLLLVSNFFWFDSPTHIDYFYDIWLANELSMYAFSFFTFQWNWTSTSLPSQFFVIRLTCMNHPPSRQLTSTCNLIVLPLRNVFLFYMLLMLTSACFVIG